MLLSLRAQIKAIDDRGCCESYPIVPARTVSSWGGSLLWWLCS